MDWWSLLFIILIGSSLIYLGPLVSIVVRAHWTTSPELTYLKDDFLVLAMLINGCWLLASLLLVADYNGWITMWEIGYALAR